MTEKQRQRAVDKAKLQILFTCHFFACGVAKLPVVFDESVKTACTDGDVIRWNPTWFEALEEQVRVTVLAHEVAHCLLGHLWRAPGGRDACDWDRWNQATDHVVNNMLKEFGQAVTSKRLADPFPFPKDQVFLANPAYIGMAEETVYAVMGSKPPGQGGGQGNSVAGPSQGKPGAPKPGQSCGQSSKSPINDPSASGGAATFAEMMPPKRDAAGQKQQKTEWDATLMQSVAAMKGRGPLPGSLSRFVDEMLNPSVPWQELLRTFLREQCTDDWDFSRPNQYFDESEFILPSLHSERIGAVVFATDWSGSINRELANQFEAEKQSCLDEMRPSKLVDMIFDTRVTSTKEYRLGDKIESKAQAGGGTDFRCVFKECEAMPVPPKCLVILTDLDGTMPDVAPEYKVLWVSYGGDKAPFGEVAKVA